MLTILLGIPLIQFTSGVSSIRIVDVILYEVNKDSSANRKYGQFSFPLYGQYKHSF
jgi:hypothetical protein